MASSSALLRSCARATPVALALACALPATAPAADVVGTESPWWTGSFSTVSVSPGEIVFNAVDPRPGSQLAAPSSGVITRWRTEEFSGALAVQLQVVRDVGGGAWRVVASGPVQTRADALSVQSGFGQRFEWSARVRIAAGDQLALRQADPSFSFFFGGQQPVVGGTTLRMSRVGVGDAAVVPAAWMTPDNMIGLNADVEPDADGDGWGDETQDRCLAVASQDQTDTDRDGLGDVCDLDDDGDALDDADEPSHGTDPLDPDSDDDRLDDGDEVTRGSDPTAADSDGDGLDDAAEVALGTDPTATDSDSDGVGDGDDRCPSTKGDDGEGCPVTTVELPGQTVVVPATPAALPTVSFASPAAPLKLRRPAPVAIELVVSGATPGATVELLRGDDVLCRWTHAPYACTWQPDGAAVGRSTLVAVVRTASFGSIVATRTVRMGRFLPAGLTASAALARVRGELRSIATATVALPDEVSARQGCTGWALVRTVRGRTVLASRRARVGGDCTIRSTAVLPAWATNAGKLRTDVRFLGNSVLTPLRASAGAEASRSHRAAPSSGTRIARGEGRG